jgi:DNA polymerase-3 subunit delta
MPIYLFWGDEDFNIEQRLDKLKKTVLKDDINPLNYKKYDNPDFATLDEILRSQGMLFGAVLHIIKADKYFLGNSTKLDLDDKKIEQLIKSVENLGENTHVVLVCNTPKGEGKKPDSRKKLYKTIQKYGSVESFETFKPWEDYKVIPWIKQRAKEKDMVINQSAAHELFQAAGPFLRELDTQLEKLKLLAHPNKTITEDMVFSICAQGENIFRLCDLILDKKYGKALMEISKLLERDSALSVTAFLHATFARLILTKLNEDSSPIEIAKILGVHEFVAKQNLQKIRGVDIKELVRLKQNLTQAEFQIKTGAIQDSITAFELALTQPKVQVAK